MEKLKLKNHKKNYLHNCIINKYSDVPIKTDPNIPTKNTTGVIAIPANIAISPSNNNAINEKTARYINNNIIAITYKTAVIISIGTNKISQKKIKKIKINGFFLSGGFSSLCIFLAALNISNGAFKAQGSDSRTCRNFCFNLFGTGVLAKLLLGK